MGLIRIQLNNYVIYISYNIYLPTMNFYCNSTRLSRKKIWYMEFNINTCCRLHIWKCKEKFHGNPHYEYSTFDACSRKIYEIRTLLYQCLYVIQVRPDTRTSVVAMKLCRNNYVQIATSSIKIISCQHLLNWGYLELPRNWTDIYYAFFKNKFIFNLFLWSRCSICIFLLTNNGLQNNIPCFPIIVQTD